MSYDLKSIKQEFKNKGIFYTTNELALYIKSFVNFEVNEVYDPTCGDGSLLSVFDDNALKFGQEINQNQLEIANSRLKNFIGVCGDTLKSPAFFDKKFKCIVANPPFSIKWEPPILDDMFNDERFLNIPAMPPQSKADYAFILHILHYLDNDGIAVTLNYPGILYRGNSEYILRKWLVENKITTQSRLNENKIPGVDVEVDDDMITLSGDSGDYDGFIEDDGTVSFTVTNDEEEFDENNWKSILGKKHVFVKIANAIDTKVEALDDYVMITVKADDLTSMNESKLNEDLASQIAALPNHHTAEDTEEATLVVGKYAVVHYDESDEGGEDMYVVWDNTVNQDEIGSYDDEPEFESTDPAEVAAFLKKNS